MNKQRPSQIAWTDMTWNPTTGCSQGCWYCYARRFAARFHRPFRAECHPGRLNAITSRSPKKNSRIFVCSTGDLLDPAIPIAFVVDTIAAMRRRPDCTFQILTKHPERYELFPWPPNAWLGTSIAEFPDRHRATILAQAFLPETRVRWLAVCPALSIFPKDVATALRHFQWIVLEPLHHYGARRQAQSEGCVREWIRTAHATGTTARLFIKGMARPLDNFPQDFPEAGIPGLEPDPIHGGLE